MKKRYTRNEVLELLLQDGWMIKNQEGSHKHLIHPTKKGKVTVAGKGNSVLPPGTLRSILKQAGLL